MLLDYNKSVDIMRTNTSTVVYRQQIMNAVK